MTALTELDDVLDSFSTEEKTESHNEEVKSDTMTPEYIIKYLVNKSESNDKLIKILGSPSKQEWVAKECGDGNINYIFIVSGCNGSVVVKQAPPFVRLVGPEWQLKQQRLSFEIAYTEKLLQYSSINAPKIYLVDNDQYLFVMEDLNQSSMLVFRSQIAKGIGIKLYPNIGKHIGVMLANILFKTSDLYICAEDKWNALKLFTDNNEMVSLTEQVIFEEPFYEAKLNRYQENDEYKKLCPQMVDTVKKMRCDAKVIRNVYNLRRKFRNLHQALVHGDLHTGSIMCNSDRSVAIDAEFSYYGPMFVDVGLFIGNMLLSCFSQQLYDKNGDRNEYIKYLNQQTIIFWREFSDNFMALWNNKECNKGNLIPETLGNDKIRAEYKNEFMHEIWRDSILFAGIILIRRTLGIADGVEFRIDVKRNKERWDSEEKACRFGRDILNDTVNTDTIELVIQEMQKYL